ncbi:hypothetical protein E5676_scaffold293G00530 [Cucumis melo var. makuwa]|uniref:Uncharacterized protein n=1 Tax=Cucumis melo var. makuwa TaxID=1194695 RepID=A0A5D3BZD9_CUCMM|nr:hypothetical protein E6C27_scaffold88G00710 [Cucumis melo var. makuwa]TYK03556.1 hypothetical protein E5676_scaffold293G00530 [Cucumis melo var. makuwa]
MHASSVSPTFWQLVCMIGIVEIVDFGSFVISQLLHYVDSYALKLPIGFPWNHVPNITHHIRPPRADDLPLSTDLRLPDELIDDLHRTIDSLVHTLILILPSSGNASTSIVNLSNSRFSFLAIKGREMCLNCWGMCFVAAAARMCLAIKDILYQLKG